jgi:hypothetical protein
VVWSDRPQTMPALSSPPCEMVPFDQTSCGVTRKLLTAKPAKVGLVCHDLTVAQGISGTFVRPARGNRMRKFTEAERRRLIHMYGHRAGARGLVREDLFAIGFALNRAPSEVV